MICDSVHLRDVPKVNEKEWVCVVENYPINRSLMSEGTGGEPNEINSIKQA